MTFSSVFACVTSLWFTLRWISYNQCPKLIVLDGGISDIKLVVLSRQNLQGNIIPT